MVTSDGDAFHRHLQMGLVQDALRMLVGSLRPGPTATRPHGT